MVLLFLSSTEKFHVSVQDCDDNDNTVVKAVTWYKDEDSDGWYTEKQDTSESPGDGWTKNEGNGEGDGCPKDPCCHTDGLPFYEDKDTDGWYVKGSGNKCPTDVGNDSKLSRTNPNSTEDCDDGDTNLKTKNECGICTNDANEGKVTCYIDNDKDGFRNWNSTPEKQCNECKDGYTSNTERDYDDDCFKKENHFWHWATCSPDQNPTPIPDPKDKKIDDAIQKIKDDLLGHTYKIPESFALRTEKTTAALEFSDCSELVSRYLEALGVTNGVKSISTWSMTNEEGFREATGNDNISFVDGSKKSKKFVPQKGDIFVWRASNGGHTGVVTGISDDNKTIFILEALSASGSREENTFNKAQGKNRVRNSQYKVDSRALSNHAGWKGYFRPQL